VSYAIIKSGALDYLLRGEISYLDFGVYAVIHLQADFSTGIWWGSAPRLVAAAPRGTTLREVQRCVQTLEQIRFLRPFHEHGARGNYPVLINKYDVKMGALKGKRLNAWKSESWRKPLYESCAEVDADTHAEGDADAAPYQYSGYKTQESGELPAPEKTPARDSKQTAVLADCQTAFETRYGRNHTWGAREAKKLRDFLTEHPKVEAHEIVRRYRNLLESNAHFHAEKHGSLFHLLSNFDVFMDGPVFDRVGGGTNGNGKRNADDPNKRTQLRIAAASGVA
jgi:hypothetical protein